MTGDRIKTLTLVDNGPDPLPGYMQHEQNDAIDNLMRHSRFQPANDQCGPYDVTLSIEDHRLVICMRNDAGNDLNMLVLALKPYRRLIQDYFLMIDSYEEARREATREKLEAIDMGRRGLHNEGAELLRKRLHGKIDMDMETARRLFTLICSLHKSHLRLLR